MTSFPLPKRVRRVIRGGGGGVANPFDAILKTLSSLIGSLINCGVGCCTANNGLGPLPMAACSTKITFVEDLKQ